MSQVYKCMECGYELIVGDYTRTVDGRSCSKCGGHTLRSECSNNIEKDIKPNHSKAIGGITVDVSIKGYDKTKQQLRNIEATYDRILEKQEKVKSISINGHELLQRIDNDCGRIVRMLQGKSTKEMDKIAEYDNIESSVNKEVGRVMGMIMDATVTKNLCVNGVHYQCGGGYVRVINV